jgi:hypothetical protein
MTGTDYDGYPTLEEAIAALEDLYATGEVQAWQARIDHRPDELRSYVIVIGRKRRLTESCTASTGSGRAND